MDISLNESVNFFTLSARVFPHGSETFYFFISFFYCGEMKLKEVQNFGGLLSTLDQSGGLST